MRVSREIQNLIPYTPGKPIEETKRELGLSEVYKLASNENPLGPSPKAVEAIKKALSEVHRYPDPSCYELKKAWERHHQVAPENIVFGNGSNELIDLLIRIFCEPGESILTSEAAFLAYGICARAARVNVRETPLAEGYKFDAKAIIEELKSAEKNKVRLLFIANPNNPTGTYLNEAELDSILKVAHENSEVLTIIDEAYVEFVRAKDYKQGLDFRQKYPRLCILSTMSKVFGMAGLRLGALVAPADVIDLVNRVRNPFNVNTLAQVAAVASFDDKEYLAQVQKTNWEGLDYFYHELEALGLPFARSEANFIFFDTLRDASEVYTALLRRGVIARPVKNYGFPRHLRLSVGLRKENEVAIKALKQVMEEIPVQK